MDPLAGHHNSSRWNLHRGLGTVAALHPGSHGWDAGSDFLEHASPVDAVKSVGKIK